MASSTRSPALLRGARRLRARLLLWRRPLAALLAAAGVLVAVRAATAPPPPTVGVVVAARDLPGGTPLRAEDLTRASLPAEAVPDGALRGTDGQDSLVGRTLAAPVRRGEPLTDVRVVADGLLAGYPSLVAAPVRVTDPEPVALLRVGDTVDVVATDPGTGRARVVTEQAPVVALPRPAARDQGPGAGALVVLALPHETAVTLAGRAATDLVSVLISE